MAPIRMDHATIRPSQSLVKGRGPAAQFRLSDGALGSYLLLAAGRPRGQKSGKRSQVLALGSWTNELIGHPETHLMTNKVA